MKVDHRLPYHYAAGIGLVLLLGSVQIQWSRHQTSSRSQLIDTIQGRYCPVEVLDHRELNIRFMRCDGTILGGMHLTTGESAFRAFVIMSAIRYTNRFATNALVIGLGAGSLHRILQDQNLQVDTVEIEAAVVEAARKHFQWQPNGVVVIEDAYLFMKQKKSSQMYDFVILDVFTTRRRKISRMYSLDSIQLLKSHLKPEGTVAVNLVTFVRSGSEGGRHPIGVRMFNTLKQAFQHVRCFIDNDPEQTPANLAVNLICFGSDSDIIFDINKHIFDGRNTANDVLQHFQSWELQFPIDSAAVFTAESHNLISAEDEAIHKSIEQQIASVF